MQKKALGPQRVIMVCNAAYGRIEDLPFDIRGKSVIGYNYKPDAPPADARNELVTRLKKGIESALSITRETAPSNHNAEFTREHFKKWRSDRTTFLAQGKAPTKLAKGAIAIVHLVPALAFSDSIKLDLHSVKDKIMPEMAPGGRSWGYIYNEHSITSADGGTDRGPVYNYVQVFQNGIIEHASVLPASEAEVNLLHVAELLVNGLKQISTAPEKLGLLGPFMIALDIVNTTGATIRSENNYSFFTNPRAITKPVLSPPLEIVNSLVPEDAKHLKQSLDQVWRAAGYERCSQYNESGRLPV